MTKLDEIEAYVMKRDPEFVSVLMKRKDADLLTRAIRQLGNERNAYQGVVDAVDERFNEFDSESDIRQALRALSRISNPDRDVLELIPEPK